MTGHVRRQIACTVLRDACPPARGCERYTDLPRVTASLWQLAYAERLCQRSVKAVLNVWHPAFDDEPVSYAPGTASRPNWDATSTALAKKFSVSGLINVQTSKMVFGQA